jgi:prepilin-type N-terminal cleavage/methylation domain-containing protein
MRGRGRGGFTLIEVLIVSVMLGVLAGIATPTMARAIDRAGAAKVVADARNLSVAVRSFLETGGTLPASADWGVAPSSLGPYLAETMTFVFRDVEYRFVTLPGIGVAELWVRYSADSGVGAALQRFRRPGEVTWTPTQATFVLAK